MSSPMKLCFLTQQGHLWAALRDPAILNQRAGWIVTDIAPDQIPTIDDPLSLFTVAGEFDCAPIAGVDRHGIITDWRSPQWEAIYNAAVPHQPRPMLVNQFEYVTSRDYEDLWKQAQVHSIVCIVGWSRDASCRDIAQTIAVLGESGDRPTEISVSARGICYFHAVGREEFLSECEKSNLEWIER